MPRVTGLVLAGGGSLRLGQARHLLPYRGTTLLDAVLATARACRFDQLLVALGGSAEEVRARVDLSGAQVVENPAYGEGCASLIAAAMAAVDPASDVLVLLLGDQPGVRDDSVHALLTRRGDAPRAVCRYDDGRGHPVAFTRAVFGDLAALHGDKAVWTLLAQRPDEVVDVRIRGPAPPRHALDDR